jgi:hypothetical protein
VKKTSHLHKNSGVSDYTATDRILSVILKKNKVDTSKTQRGDSFLNFQIVKFQARFPADPIIIDIDYHT